MDHVDTNQLASFLRNMALFVGAFVTSSGVATGAEWETGTGILISAIVFGISYWKNHKNKKAVAVATPPAA